MEVSNLLGKMKMYNYKTEELLYSTTFEGSTHNAFINKKYKNEEN